MNVGFTDPRLYGTSHPVIKEPLLPNDPARLPVSPTALGLGGGRTADAHSRLDGVLIDHSLRNEEMGGGWRGRKRRGELMEGGNRGNSWDL